MNRFGFVLAAMVALPPLAHAIPAQSGPAQTVSACGSSGDFLVPPPSGSGSGVPLGRLVVRDGRVDQRVWQQPQQRCGFAFKGVLGQEQQGLALGGFRYRLLSDEQVLVLESWALFGPVGRAYYRPEQRQQKPLPLQTLQRWEEQCLVQANYRPVDLAPIKGRPLQYRLVKNGWVYRVSWDAQQLRCRAGSLGRLEEGPSPLVSSHGFRLEQDQLIETVRLGGSRGASARYATRRYLPVTADNPKKES